ncbi:TonB-dependent receptor plug domain-containing protein [Shewanella maritima]|uniref:TonB-dependent receptor plug domain-containing protein n=1 Tax=Shewanella maritima TaxID=2520507 RepID=UPI003735D4D5
MNQKSILATSIKSALVASIAATSTISINAIAAEESANVERIQVTGSRIQRQDMETASPVTVIDASSIRAEGYNSVDEILQAQPAMAGMAMGSTTNNGARGVAQVDLRGMGANRTLVLLNGRRMVNSGSGADSAVDLNTIPVAMIARVEILKDGASAVYGSDAIAGVVNIITKKDFEGFQLDVTGGATSESDGENIELSGLYGFNTDRGNYTFGMAYSERKGVMQGDRSWVEQGASSFIPEGTLGGKQFDPETGEWGDREYGYDYTQDSWLETPNKRYSFFANAVHEFSNDVTFTGDFLYTKRKSEQMMAAQPANLDLKVCENNIKQDDCITLDDAMIAGGVQADEDGMINYRKRMGDVGNRVYEQDTDTFRISAGLAGYIDVSNGLDWDVAYTYGKNKAKTWVHNSIHQGNMEKSIYANQDAWFGGDPMTQEMIDAVSYTEATTGGNEQHIISGVISGEAFDLEAGAVAFAIGAEYRHESGYFNPDPVIVAGEGTAAQQDPTDGSFDVFSVYQEVSVPFTEKLTGEFALRFDDYSTFGNAATWKVGLTYEATSDLMLRTVAATGFRAPSVSELYGGNSGSYDYLDDPWENELDPQILVNYTSDENLDAEKSESFTAGLVYSPSYIDGLSLTLDWWRFKIEDAISRLDVQAGLNACHAGDTSACETFNITPDGDLSNLSNPLTNVGYQDTSGIDFNLAYTFEALGLDWKLNNDLTHLLNFEQDGIDYTGTIGGMYGGYAEYKNNFNISASQGDWSVMYSNRYIGEMNDVNTGEKVSSVLYHNISGLYHFTDNLSANFGVKNLTDEEPVMVTSGNEAGTVPEVYDTIGRQFYAGVSMKF